MIYFLDHHVYIRLSTVGKLVAYLHMRDVRSKEPGMGTIRK